MKIKMHNLHAFTLIEMVLAIGVAAIVLIAVNAVLFTSLHLREVTADTVDAATPVDQAVTFLRRDLQCVVTPTNGTSKVLSGSFRAGNVSSPGVPEPVAIEMFTATGALSANAPWADIQRVTYGLKNSTDGSGRRDIGLDPTPRPAVRIRCGQAVEVIEPCRRGPVLLALPAHGHQTGRDAYIHRDSPNRLRDSGGFDTEHRRTGGGWLRSS